MFQIRKTALSIMILATFSAAQAGIVEKYFQQELEKPLPMIAVQSIEQDYFQQLIDHNNPYKGTFSQRYYIDETYGPEKNAPVFLYICGEGACSKKRLNGAIRYYAQLFHAKLVAVEHRYYGESIPVNDFSTQEMRFLSTETALADVAYFQRRMTNNNNWTGKWVAFGGSYAGSLAAYYRMKYPYLVAGALASSAPVMAKENFEEYDAHVTEVTGTVCAKQMRDVVGQVEDSMIEPQKFASMKALFSASDVEDAIDFVYLIADIGASAVQYGKRDEFCNALSSATNPLEGYAAFAKKLYDDFHVTAIDFTVQGAMSEDPKAYEKGTGNRAWLYQSCKEYGYWQVANHVPSHSTRSSLIDLDYHRNACQRLFGINQPADVALHNQDYYRPLTNDLTSNIYFVNGNNDPWSTLSLSENNGNDDNPKLTYQIIQNGSHCTDLSFPTEADSPSLKEARETMVRLLKVWLKR